jgi:hypothetical protein
MAGINNLKEVYEKKGESFLNGLLNSYVIINEKLDGTFFGVKKTQDDQLKYFKKSGEITYVDQVLMKYYNSAILHFNQLSAEKLERIPANLFFGFEYFTKGDSKAIKRSELPKNGLILSYIHKLDSNGEVLETLQTREALTKWADYLGVEAPPIIFEGRLDDEQRAKILEFVYSQPQELEEKFKTTSFTKYIISILCQDDKPEFITNGEFDTLIFRFYGDSEQDAFLAKLVDPIFQQRISENKPKVNQSQDYIWLIVIDLMNHFEMYNIDELRAMVPEAGKFEEKYIDLINQIFKDFISEYNIKYDGLVLEVPEYLKRPEFELDLDLVRDPEVVNLINASATNSEIYKILLNFFRKVRKRSSSGFFTVDMISQLNLIVQKIKNLIMGDAIYEGLFPSFSQFIGSPHDFAALSEMEWAKAKSEITEPTPVNILIGQFQPVTLGHIKAAKLLKDKNGHKTILVAIKGDARTKTSPLSKELTRVLLDKVVREYPDLFEAPLIIPNGQLTEIIKELRPGYEPILWGTSDRRVKDYAIQLDHIKKRDLPLRISKEFKLVELPSFINSGEVLEFVRNSDFEAFKKATPASIASEFFNLQKEVGKSGRLIESQIDSRLIDETKDQVI